MTTYIDHTHGGVEVESDDADKAKWMLEQGYWAKKGKPKASDEDRGRYATSVPASQDPTLAENREAPGAPEPHLANVEPEGETQDGPGSQGTDSTPAS